VEQDVPKLVSFSLALFASVCVSAQEEFEEKEPSDKTPTVAFRGVRVRTGAAETVERAEREHLAAIRKGFAVQRRAPFLPADRPQPLDLGVSTFVVDDFELGLEWRPVPWAGQPLMRSKRGIDGATGTALKLECPYHDTRKSAISLPLTIDVSAFDQLVLGGRLLKGHRCHVAIAFETGATSQYFESTMVPMARKWNGNLAIDLRVKTFKCQASDWQHHTALADPEGAKRLTLLFYHPTEVTLTIDNVRLARGRPPPVATLEGQPTLPLMPLTYRKAWDALAEGEKSLEEGQYRPAAAAFEEALRRCGIIHEQDALAPAVDLMRGVSDARLKLTDEQMALRDLVRFEGEYVTRDGTSLQSALRANSRNLEARSRYARFLRALGEPEQAASEVATILRTAMAGRKMAEVAAAHAFLEELHAAHLVDTTVSDALVRKIIETAVRDAISVNPSFEPNYDLLGKLYAKEGRTDAAAQAYLAEVPPSKSRLKAPRYLVGFYFNDKAPSEDRVRYGAALSGLSILRRGGFEPALFVVPRLQSHSELRRFLRMTGAQTRFLNWERKAAWEDCTAVIFRGARKLEPAMARAALQYVGKGGGLVVLGAFGLEGVEPEVRKALMGTDTSELDRQGELLEVAASHPIVKGLEVGLALPGPRDGTGLKGTVPEQEAILRYDGSDRFALAARKVGKGRVAHLNWSGPLNTILGQAGMLTDADLFLRAVAWAARKDVPRDRTIFAERPAVKRLPERRDATEEMKVLFQDPFDGLDLSVWKIYDTEPADYEKRGFPGPSRWLAHPTLHQLVQLSNIASWGTRGAFGTNIVAGSPAWKDYVLSVWATPIDDDSFTVLFRYQNEQNYYRVLGLADFDKEWRLDRISDGRAETIARVRDKCYIPGQTYLLEAAVHGDKIHVYLDGDLLMQAADTTHRSGRVGLGCITQSGMAFDDLVVYANGSGLANSEEEARRGP